MPTIGFSFGPFDLGTAGPPNVAVGPLSVRNTRVILSVLGDDIIVVDPPDAPGSPFLLSAVLSNRTGTEILTIERNEWRTPITNWDVQIVGSAITIHNESRDVALVLKAEPPRGLRLDRLDMFHQGIRLTVHSATGLTVMTHTGNTATMSDAAVVIDGSQIALEVDAGGAISMGRGGGSMEFTGQVSTGTMTGAAVEAARPAGVPYRRTTPKVGRNAPCPCGSGRKYKKCHGNARPPPEHGA